MRTFAEIMRPWAYLSWPNRITMVRLLLVAPFVVLMQHQQQNHMCRYLALVIFMLMAASDAADGILARRLNRKTRLGAILDPLADKTLIICAAVLLSLPYSAVPEARLPDWVVVLIVGKDLWLLLGFVVVFMVTGHMRVAPTRVGKATTAAQLCMVSVVLLSPDLNRLGWKLGTRLAEVLWWTVSILCVLAAIGYTRLGLSFMAEADQDDSGRDAGEAA